MSSKPMNLVDTSMKTGKTLFSTAHNVGYLSWTYLHLGNALLWFVSNSLSISHRLVIFWLLLIAVHSLESSATAASSTLTR